MKCNLIIVVAFLLTSCSGSGPSDQEFIDTAGLIFLPPDKTNVKVEQVTECFVSQPAMNEGIIAAWIVGFSYDVYDESTGTTNAVEEVITIIAREPPAYLDMPHGLLSKEYRWNRFGAVCP